MKKKFKNMIWIIIILSIFILFGCKDNRSGDTIKKESKDDIQIQTEQDEEDDGGEVKVEIGYAAPKFSVELLSGETLKLSDCRGKAVFINFWATWCGPCVREMPDIQKLSDAFPDDLVVIAINCGEKKDKVKNFIDDKGYTFNVGIDEDGKVQGKYPTMGIPYSVILDADGIVAATHLGADMFEVYAADVNAALGK